MTVYHIFSINNGKKIYAIKNLRYNDAVKWLRENCGNTYSPFRANGVTVYVENEEVQNAV